MSPETGDPELKALADALAGLAPCPSAVNRDQVLFRAGQASFRKLRWLGLGASVALSASVIAWALASALQPASQHVERIVYTPILSPVSPGGEVAQMQVPETFASLPEPVERSRPRIPMSYFHLEQLVLQRGVDALPAAGSPPPSDQRATLDEPDLSLNRQNRTAGLRMEFP